MDYTCTVYYWGMAVVLNCPEDDECYFFVSRIKANKSQSEGSGDSDSLGSLQDSTGGSSTQLPGQGSLEDGESTQPPLDYDTVLVISLNTFSPPECPGLMAEEKVLSTVQVSWGLVPVHMR